MYAYGFNMSRNFETDCVSLTEPAGPQSLLGKIAERAIWPKPADATHHNLTGLSLEIGESKTPGYEDSTNGWVQ
jgi:hypothetical protein